MDTSNIVSDAEIAVMTVSQLEDLEFRIYAELRNRETEVIASLHEAGTCDSEGAFSC